MAGRLGSSASSLIVSRAAELICDIITVDRSGGARVDVA